MRVQPTRLRLPMPKFYCRYAQSLLYSITEILGSIPIRVDCSFWRRPPQTTYCPTPGVPSRTWPPPVAATCPSVILCEGNDCEGIYPRDIQHSFGNNEIDSSIEFISSIGKCAPTKRHVGLYESNRSNVNSFENVGLQEPSKLNTHHQHEQLAAIITNNDDIRGMVDEEGGGTTGKDCRATGDLDSAITAYHEAMGHDVGVLILVEDVANLTTKIEDFFTDDSHEWWEEGGRGGWFRLRSSS